MTHLPTFEILVRFTRDGLGDGSEEVVLIEAENYAQALKIARRDPSVLDAYYLGIVDTPA